MMENHWVGVLPQVANARAAGATDEEIMEVAFLACYAVSKAKMVDTAACMQNVLENATYKNTRRLEE